jgi:type IV pilus assembly protein PilB
MAIVHAPRLGDILVDSKIITREQLKQALEIQVSSRERLGAVLLANGWVTEEQITYARSVQMDVSYVNLAELDPDPFAVALLPFELANHYHMLPMSIHESGEGHEGRLRVAMTNPWDIEAIDLVQRHVKMRLEPILASRTSLVAALQSAYHGAQGAAHKANMAESVELAQLEIETPIDGFEDVDVDETLRQSDQGPVIRFVNSLFSDAVFRGASDIHIEPQQRDFQIRYRIDGQLRVVRNAPRKFLAPSVSRIKVMADMDIAERRLPLDGRIALKIDGRNIDIRVSTLPTQYGERVVMRILDRTATFLKLEQLGFSTRNDTAFRRMIEKPTGMILVTGPTGSGKTTTLYAALNAIKSNDTNIITCEDPIEYKLEGVSQSAVNERAGLTFARQLRAILRQDPDVILVGEIRDTETAEIALRAALTGHLVMSTLHCNDAAGAVHRLMDMGIPPYLIGSTITGVVAQRLVPRLCPDCRRLDEDADQLRLMRQLGGYSEDEPLRCFERVGCSSCNHTGTRGRVAVHEVLVVDDEIRRLTIEQAVTRKIRAAAYSAGMIPMIRDGLDKVNAGICALDDVLRKVDSIDEE